MSDEREALILIKSDVVLAEAYEKFMVIDKATDQKEKFIRKQVEDARKLHKEANDEFWKTINSRIHALGLSEKDAPLSMDKGVIYKGRNVHPLAGFLSEIFGGRDV